MGMCAFRPPMFRMSAIDRRRGCARVHRVDDGRHAEEGQALKKACVKTWKKPAVNAPTPVPGSCTRAG